MKPARTHGLAALSLFVLGAAAPAPAPPAPVPSAHEQAVVELFKLMDVERTMLAGANAVLEAQVQGTPALEPYRDVLFDWAKKYLTWETMGPALVKLEMETFSESEVRELIAFYRTPTGQKALTRMPEVLQKGAAIGAEVARAHQDELQRMILERKETLEKEKKP
jgi:hypothetical protein